MKPAKLVAVPVVGPAGAFGLGLLAGADIRGWPALLLAFVAVSRPGCHRNAVLLLLFVVGGALHGRAVSLDAMRDPVPSPTVSGDGPRLISAVVRESREGRFGDRLRVELDDRTRVDVDVPRGATPAPGTRVRLFGAPRAAGPGPNPGSGSGRLRPPRLRVRAPAGVLIDAAPSAEGPVARARALITERIGRVVTGSSRALLRALLLGDRSGLDAALGEEVRRLGLSHLLAISGMHVGILLGIAVTVARALVPAGGRWAIPVLLLAVAYAPVAGGSGSVVRATAMGGAVVALLASGRRLDGIGILAGAFLVTAAIDPAGVFAPAYALSYLATLGILVYLRVGSPYLEGRAGRHLSTWLGISVAATVATLPAVAAWFGRIPLGGILYSVPGGFLVAAILTPAFAGLLLLPLPALSGLAFAAAWPAAWLLEHGIRAGLPGPGLDLPVGVATALLLVTVAGIAALRTRSRWRVGVVLLAAAIAPLHATPSVRVPEVTLLDVGAGDAILLRLPGGRDVLIDTGRPAHAGRVARACRRLGAHDVELVITHPDEDHDGGLPALVADGTVRTVTVGVGGGIDADVDVPVREVARGDTLWRHPRGRLVCVHPTRADADLPDNERSVTLRLDWDRTSILLTGDLEHEGLRRFLDREAGESPTSAWRVLKLGHHGSPGATPDALLRYFPPTVALVSLGADLPDGTASTLAHHRVPVAATGGMGAIRLRMGGPEPLIERWRGRWRSVPVAPGAPGVIETPVPDPAPGSDPLHEPRGGPR